MIGWHRGKGRFGSLAGAAATAAAVGVALVALDGLAVGSSRVRGHERSDDIAYALSAGRDGTLVVAGVSGSSTTGSEGDWALAGLPCEAIVSEADEQPKMG